MVQFASYVRRVLHKTRLIFSRINGQNLYPVYKNDDESDPGNYRPMSLLSILISRMYHRLIRAYNHGQKLLTHGNYQRFFLV